MCGIVGILYADSNSVDPFLLKRMTQIIAHRGPDDEGHVLLSMKANRAPVEFHEPDEVEDTTGYSVGLGFRRLSIIDLSPAGSQPMCNEDGSIWVVFNGEFYNFVEYQQMLQDKGHCFRSRTDTEVILHLYEEYGIEGTLERMNGMFAFGLWDAGTGTLYVARDRVGQKPLSYFHDGNCFYFASEFKAILEEETIPRDVDLQALDEYLTFGYISAPRTIFEAIRKLPPAHYGVWRNGVWTIREYWDVSLDAPVQPRDEKSWNEEMLGLLEDAVRLRLVSDVPLGAFLSGGIDSSTVVALMAGLKDDPVKTFSIGFREAYYDETQYARVVAERCATQHVERTVTPNMVDVIDRIVWQFDEPFGDASAVPTYYVSQATREYVTVSLSGDGGDELFAGYDSYPLVLSMQKYDGPLWARLLTGKLSRWYPTYFPFGMALYWRSFSPEQRFVARHAGMSIHAKRRLYGDALRKVAEEWDVLEPKGRFLDRCQGQDLLTTMQYNDFKSYHPEDILVKVDRMSMLHSLECRSPFLDHRVVEAALQGGRSFSMDNRLNKGLLRSTVRELLPRRVLERGKQGFAMPVAEWLRGELFEVCQDTLTDPHFLHQGWVKPRVVRGYLNMHRSGIRSYANRLWYLFVLALWTKHYL